MGAEQSTRPAASELQTQTIGDLGSREQVLAQFVEATGWSCEDATALLSQHNWQLQPAMAEVLGDGLHDRRNLQATGGQGLVGYGGYGGYPDALGNGNTYGYHHQQSHHLQNQWPPAAMAQRIPEQQDAELAAALAVSRQQHVQQAMDQETEAALLASSSENTFQERYDLDLAAAISASSHEHEKQKEIERRITALSEEQHRRLEHQEQERQRAAEEHRRERAALDEQRRRLEEKEREQDELKARVRALELLVEQQRMHGQAPVHQQRIGVSAGTQTEQKDEETADLKCRLQALEAAVGQQQDMADSSKIWWPNMDNQGGPVKATEAQDATFQTNDSGIPQEPRASTLSSMSAEQAPTKAGSAGRAPANTAAAVLSRARGTSASKKKRIIKDGQIVLVDE